jgi:hypothetical protein
MNSRDEHLKVSASVSVFGEHLELIFMILLKTIGMKVCLPNILPFCSTSIRHLTHLRVENLGGYRP